MRKAPLFAVALTVMVGVAAGTAVGKPADETRNVDCDRIQAAAAAKSAQGDGGTVLPGKAAAIARDLGASRARVVVCLEVGVPLEGASASASTAQGYPAGGEPPPPSPDYAYRNGEVYVDGDEVLDCRTFVESFDGGYDEFGDQAQARRVLERCEQAGSPDGVDVPPEVRAEIKADRRLGGLPETGGAPALPLGVGLLLASSAGLLVFARRA